MTAILRILEDGDLKWQVALTGVQRIGGITFYELDVADIPHVTGAKDLERLPPAGDELRQPDVDLGAQPRHPNEPGYELPEDTP